MGYTFEYERRIDESRIGLIMIDQLYCLDNHNWTLIIFFIFMTLAALVGSILVLLHDIKLLKEKITKNANKGTMRTKRRYVGVADLEAGIASALGGNKHLRQEIHESTDFDLLIKKGFPWDASKFLQESLRITDKDFARILGINESKLRRLRKEGKRVPPVASDRLYRLAQIFSKTKGVLENENDAIKWLHHPQIGLGGRIPLKMIETEAGADMVKNILGRIENGILAGILNEHRLYYHIRKQFIYLCNDRNRTS